MQETWKLTLAKPENPSSEELKQFLSAHQKDLGIFLSYYFKKEGGLAENVDLSSDINFKNRESGDFELEFDLVHFNACLAIHGQKRDRMKVTFEINGKELILTGPYWPERGMDEI